MSANHDRSVADGNHSPDEVREAVTAILPDADLRDAIPIERGKNAVYDLTVEANGERRGLILKVGDHHFPGGCRAEPYLIEAVAERTEIPVPEVVGTGELGGDPYFVAERVPGENSAFVPERLAPEAFEELCFEAGRNLGELHDAFPADGWGMLAVEESDDECHFAREFADWPTYFEAWLTHNVERLEDTRFADLRPSLAERATETADELREYAPFDPVITHGDYRLGNLLVDPGNRPVTRAVIDWATPVAATPAYELAVTEAILVDWPEFDADRQRALRALLYDGYRRATDASFGERFEIHRRRCRLGARLRLMVNLREEIAGRSADAVDARAREHRAALREYGVE